MDQHSPTPTIERVGRRAYVRGDTYALRHRLREAGATWDPEERAWWIGTGRVARIEEILTSSAGLLSGQHRCCPPKKHNDLVRAASGVWSREHGAWLLPSAEALATVERRIAEADAAASRRRDREREAAARAEAERRADSARSIPELLAAAGRTLRGEGAPKSGRRYLGHGRRTQILGDLPRAGEIVTWKDGPYLITEVEAPYLVTEDDIEDQDAWSSYPDGSRWYVSYAAVPVERTVEELEAVARAEAQRATAEARRALVARVQVIEHHSATRPTFLGDLTERWASRRSAGSEVLYGDTARLVYTISSYDDGPHYWVVEDPALAAEAARLAGEGVAS